MHQATSIQPETRLVCNKSGYWEIRWRERDAEGVARTRFFSCRTKDASVAQDVERTFLRTFADGAAVTQSLTVGDVLDAYMSRHVLAKGLSKAQGDALAPIRRYFGTFAVANLTPVEIEKYTRDQLQRLSSGSVRRRLGALNAALKWAKDKGLLPGDFHLKIDLPPDSPPRLRYLPAPEEARMWGLASALAVGQQALGRRRIGLFLCIALQTAARDAAIRGLTWDRVDFQTGLIDFRDPTARVTKKRRVAVPMSKKLRVVLEAEHRRAKTPYVLGRPGVVRKNFERFIEVHGFDCSIHDLRRTWATLRIQWGASLEDVAAVLGDTIQVVQKHYAHFSPDFLRGAVDMDGPLAGRN